MEPSAKDHISVYIEAIFDGGDRLGQPTTPENEFTLPIRNARGSRTSSPSSAPSRAVTMPNPVPQSQSSTPTTSCGSSGPIIKIISQQELERSTMPPSPQGPEASSSSESNVKRKSKSKLSPKFDFVLMSMVYNQVRILPHSKWDTLQKAENVGQAKAKSRSFSSYVNQPIIGTNMSSMASLFRSIRCISRPSLKI